jgi:hypothetical protein
MRKALPRDTEKKSIIPLKHPVTPGKYDRPLSLALNSKFADELDF